MWSWAAAGRPASFARYILAALVLLFVTWGFRRSYYNGVSTTVPYTQLPPDSIRDGGRPAAGSIPKIYGNHPIDLLIKAGDEELNALLKKETFNIGDAAKAYRERRGRHPPPGFEAWHQFAVEKGAIVVEEFWDQIYHDLGPFWGLEPKRIRQEAFYYEMVISIRDGKVQPVSEWFWTKIWADLVGSIADYLPDLDMALNAMDEPRIVTEWEELNRYMDIERATRKMPPPEKVKKVYEGLKEEEWNQSALPEKVWEDTLPYWKIARRGCPPNSLAQTTPVMTDFSNPPQISMDNAAPHLYQGFVSNYSLSTDICHQPDLQGLSGVMIRPLSVSSTGHLFPMFGGSKLGVNNEILLPAPMYWSNDQRFSTEYYGPPWTDKADSIIWRGVATGGKNNPDVWRGFQRHRFVAMVNGTKITRAENGIEPPANWALPSDAYGLKASKNHHLGDWVSTFSDVGFVDLFCEQPQEDGSCYYTNDQFERFPGMTMASQFDHKYLPDIDGNSFSGRYRSFLLSTSLPIKSTLFREWHDSRLVAWKHFVPMDNRFEDFYGIMEYFLGYTSDDEEGGAGNGGYGAEAHDAAAEKIATEGQAWANRVLRPEDMQVYVLRLLLEYARVCDDDREIMGYVEDLVR